MPPASPAKSSRIDVIDALRGSALLGLFLVHCVEHFDFGRYPANPPPWLAALNKQAGETVFFLFAGKAYAIFAMMFGVSFFMIIDGAARRGLDFRGRFLWRLCVLGIIGYAFGLIYCGEILSMLAVLGLPLAFFYRTPARILGWLSILLLLQLPFLWQLNQSCTDPAYTPLRLGVGSYYKEMYSVFEAGGFVEVCRVNAWTSLLGRSAWSVENGRYLQMFGLFIWGLLLGRSRVFENFEASVRLAWRALTVALVAWAILYWVQKNLPLSDLPKTPRGILRNLLSSYMNLAQTIVWVGGFVLLYQLTRLRNLFRLLAPFGRTSLTCYVTQNVIGVILFYHFGAGLFRQWGQFQSLLYGFVFLMLQLLATHAWLRYFHYGPLEWLWRCLTFFSFEMPFRKRKTIEAAA